MNQLLPDLAAGTLKPWVAVRSRMQVDGHPHEIEAEYINASDALVLDVFEREGALRIRYGIPCPECGESVEVVASADRVEDSDLELSLEDAEERE